GLPLRASNRRVGAAQLTLGETYVPGLEPLTAAAPQKAKAQQAAGETFAQNKMGAGGRCDGCARNVAKCGEDARRSSRALLRQRENLQVTEARRSQRSMPQCLEYQRQYCNDRDHYHQPRSRTHNAQCIAGMRFAASNRCCHSSSRRTRRAWRSLIVPADEAASAAGRALLLTECHRTPPAC